MPWQVDKLPTNFSVRDFKPGNAWRRSAVRSCHAAGIEKQNATAPFVSWNVRVTVQENVDIIGRSIRRNVLQLEFQTASHKIADQWPFEIAVTISPDNDHPRSDRAQLVKNRFCANVAKMPDLISVLRHLPHAVRQTIVRVGENEDTQDFFRLFLHVCTRNLNAPRLKTKSRHAGEALEAMVNAGFDVALAIRPLDLLNEVT
jgi:hypothetical protein